MSATKLGPAIGGVALALAGGLLAGVTYYSSSQARMKSKPGPIVLGTIVGAGPVVAGLLLYGSHPNLSKGLISGGFAAGLIAPTVAGGAAIYGALTAMADLQRGILPTTSPGVPTTSPGVPAAPTVAGNLVGGSRQGSRSVPRTAVKSGGGRGVAVSQKYAYAAPAQPAAQPAPIQTSQKFAYPAPIQGPSFTPPPSMPAGGGYPTPTPLGPGLRDGGRGGRGDGSGTDPINLNPPGWTEPAGTGQSHFDTSIGGDGGGAARRPMY